MTYFVAAAVIVVADEIAVAVADEIVVAVDVVDDNDDVADAAGQADDALDSGKVVIEETN